MFRSVPFLDPSPHNYKKYYLAIYFLGDAPNLRELISFPMAGCTVMNVIEKIGAKCVEFGVMLLEDDGSRINAIDKEKRGNVSDIICHIFMLWRQGKGRQPVTWATLIAVLRDICLNALALDIEGNLLP